MELTKEQERVLEASKAFTPKIEQLLLSNVVVSAEAGELVAAVNALPKSYPPLLSDKAIYDICDAGPASTSLQQTARDIGIAHLEALLKRFLDDDRGDIALYELREIIKQEQEI
jgi:hypothetical protein